MQNGVQDNEFYYASTLIFSPDGKSYNIYQEGRKQFKGKYPQYYGNISSKLSLKTIEVLWETVQDVVVECLKENESGFLREFNPNDSSDYDDFFYIFLEDLYYKLCKEPFNRNDIDGMALRMSNAADKSNTVSTNSLDDRHSGEKIYQLFKRIQTVLNNEYAKPVIEYARFEKRNRNEINALDSLYRERGFIPSKQFEKNKAEKELHCLMHSYPYTFSSTPMYLYICPKCKTLYSSLIYDDCPNGCNPDAVLVHTVLNGPYSNLSPKFIKSLCDTMGRVLDSGNFEEVESMRFDSSQKEFYNNFYAKIVEELQMAVVDDYIKPLEEIVNRGYSPESLETLRNKRIELNSLPKSKQLILDNKGYVKKLTDAIGKFEKIRDEKAVYIFFENMDRSTSDNISRSIIANIQNDFKGLESPQQALANSMGYEQRLNQLNERCDMLEAQECLDVIDSRLKKINLDNIATCESIIDSISGLISDLHRNVREIVEAKPIYSVFKQKEEDVRYRKTLNGLNQITTEIHNLQNLNVDDDFVSRFNSLHKMYKNASADSYKDSILKREGYDSIMRVLGEKVTSFKTDQVESKVSELVNKIDFQNLVRDANVVSEIRSIFGVLEPNVMECLIRRTIYSDFERKSKELTERINQKSFDDVIAALEVVEEMLPSDRFLSELSALRQEYVLQNDEVKKNLTSKANFESRMSYLEKKELDWKDLKYATQLEGRIKNAERFNTYERAEEIESLYQEMCKMTDNQEHQLLTVMKRDSKSDMAARVDAIHTYKSIDSKLKSLKIQSFSGNTAEELDVIESLIQRIPSRFADHYLDSDSYIEYTKIKNDFNRWQTIQLVEPIKKHIEMIDSGLESYDDWGHEIKKMYSMLSADQRQELDGWGYKERMQKYSVNVNGLLKKKLKLLADNCHILRTPESFEAYKKVLGENPEIQGDPSIQSLTCDVNRLESDYWNSQLEFINYVISENYGFMKKMTNRDATDVRKAKSVYDSLPEDKKVAVDSGKLLKLYEKSRKVGI